MFDKKLRRKMFFNRQPTLHRHGAPFVEVIPIEDSGNGTITLNPLSLEPLNADRQGPF
jgi:DNA-directed RNA polymerase beta' subunit